MLFPAFALNAAKACEASQFKIPLIQSVDTLARSESIEQIPHIMHHLTFASGISCVGNMYLPICILSNKTNSYKK